MSTLKCQMKGCESRLEVKEAVSAEARYTCKQHSPASVRKTLNFQEHAFDRGLDGETKDSEEYDRDWGMSGEPMLPGEKCEHGVYDPTEDQRYCTLCHPARVTGVVNVKKTKIGRVATFKDPDEQASQEMALVMFYLSLPEAAHRPWFRDKELGLKNRAERGKTWLKKANKTMNEQWREG